MLLCLFLNQLNLKACVCSSCPLVVCCDKQALLVWHFFYRSTAKKLWIILVSLYKLSPLTPQEMKISFLTSHPFTYSSTTGLHYVSISLFFYFSLSVCSHLIITCFFFLSNVAFLFPQRWIHLWQGYSRLQQSGERGLFFFLSLFYFIFLSCARQCCC